MKINFDIKKNINSMQRKKTRAEQNAVAEQLKNPKLIQPEQPATVGPAQQDQAMRQQMFQDQPESLQMGTPEGQQALFNSLGPSITKVDPRAEYGRQKLEQDMANGKAMFLPGKKHRQVTPYDNSSSMKPGREIEPPEQRINLDQFTSGERRPFNPNPLRLGPLQQFNSMQQQMYQTQPQPAQQQPQPETEQPQPTQQQNQLQEQQPKQIEQIAPVKKTFIKKKNTEM